jgi:hypothetical protein
VCSVRGLHRPFPPSDPLVYSRPQLKPPCGICSFTTTTFGAHRGADKSAGRITSGWDLLRQLWGSTSALPSSTSGLPQLPGLISTRPGRHTFVPNLLRHFWADIFFPGPALVGPGWHICVPVDIGGAGVNSDTPRPAYIFFWPVFTPTGRHKPIPAFPGRSSRFLGQYRGIPAQHRASSCGWASSSLNSAGPSWPLCGFSVRPSRPPSRAGTARPPRLFSAASWAPAGPQSRRSDASSYLG